MYYFDNSATTKPLEDVLATYQQVATKYFANPSSSHKLGEEAKGLMNLARKQIADILGFDDSEIFFASSGTEVNNWVMQAILPALKNIHVGRNKVLISRIEHPATMKQVNKLQELGFDIEFIKVNDDGVIDLDNFRSLLTSDVLLVSIMGVNNEVGAIQPVKDIERILKDYPQVIWHMDAVQTVTTQLELLKYPRIDMLTLSSHKFHSVKGVGILAKRNRVASQPLLFGGGQECGQRSSTENLAAIVATSRALRIMNEVQQEAKTNLSTFRQQIIDSFKQNGWQIFAEHTGSEHIICAAYAGIPGEVLLHAFESHDVYISTTSACSSRTHTDHATLTAMGVDKTISKSAIRISMAHTTTQKEVDYLIKTIKLVTDKFRQQK
ncbi:cysteine desulfurase family protein [Aerococcaceae bacterium WGS1372]